jgi:hypothetical protein
MLRTRYKEPWMARTKRKTTALPTIWEVDDELWKIINEILYQLAPPSTVGRPRTSQRVALNGII